MDNKRAHLEMIQRIIDRLTQSSFLLKGWNVVIVSALFALASNQMRTSIIWIALLPATAFWALDGYFLRQGRLFRKLYDHVRTKDEKDIDFSMDTSVIAQAVNSWGCVAFSTTLKIFHGTVLAAIIIALIAAWVK